MSIVYQCAGCQKRFKVADTSAGKRVKCKECGAIGVVPATAAVSAPVGVAAASAPPRPPRAMPAAPGAMPPPPPPPPPPPRRPAQEESPPDDDIFSTMEDLERTGQAQQDDGAYGTAPPPPPPAGGKPAAKGTSIHDLQARQAAAMGTTGYAQPVAAPWVPESLSFLDFNKPLHRKALMGAFGVLILGGLVLAVWALGKAGTDARFNAVAEEVEAKLVGKAERNDIRRRRKRDIEAYDIKYAFKVDGKQYTGEESEYHADDLPGDPRISYDEQDEHITVYYDPKNPANNRVDLPSTAFDYILCVIGVMCVPVGAFGGWRVWRYDRYASAMGT